MSIRQVYDTTALLSISLIKKLDILRKLDIDVFVPQINAKELVIDDVDAIGGLVGISKVIGVEIVPSSYILVGVYLKEFLITMNLLECIPEYAKICHGKHASKEHI